MKVNICHKVEVKELFLAGNFHTIELWRLFYNVVLLGIPLFLFYFFIIMTILKSSDTAALASRALRFVFAAVTICSA